MNYYDFVQKLAQHTATIKADVNPTIIVPMAIDYAEQRIYRDIGHMLAQVQVASSGLVSSGIRDYLINPGSSIQSNFISIDQVSVVTPASLGSSNGGTRNPLVPISREFIDSAYPSNASSYCGVPEYFARLDANNITFGPTPDQGYQIQVIGKARPSSLGPSNSSTPLTQYLPDLFFAAAMVYAANYLKIAADGPPDGITQMSAGWESQYQLLMQSAAVEQFRATFASEGWTSKQPNKVATPPRV
jgi:hypothetical protein